MTPKLTRRAALGTAAALPLAGLARPASAAGHASGPGMAPYRRVRLGDFEVTTLLAGTRPVENPHAIFGLNVDDATFAEVSAEAHIPTDVAQFFFTPTVVNTGSEVVLFDTGLNPGGITAALEAAGYAPGDVTTVVITHMHGDHIGGLAGEGGATFAEARHVTGAVEFDHWAAAGNDNFEAQVRPLADRFDMLEDGGEVTGGITAMSAFGHTPGHMVYRLESGGRQLVIAADFANHYVWSLARPDWEVRFDMDKPAAAATRKRLLDMMAADGIPFVGYHMPWPGIGYVDKRGDGYAYEAMSYQLML